MYKKLQINELKKEVNNKKINIFVAFCSFEKRCLSILQNLPIEQINSSIIFINKEAPSESLNNLKVFQRLLLNKANVIQVDLWQPTDLADQMIDALSNACKKYSDIPHVMVDITTFSHEALLIFIAMINNRFSKIEIEYAYCNAASYATEIRLKSNNWLSRGISGVRAVLGYAGEINPFVKTVLIIMVGYEDERARRIIDAIAPDELILASNDINGATDEMHSDAAKKHIRKINKEQEQKNKNESWEVSHQESKHSKLQRELGLEAYYQNPPDKTISCNDPFKTELELNKIISELDVNKNIIIVPLNSKLATVGAALVAFKNSKIQICYANALTYNIHYYSTPGKMCYLFSFNDSENE